MEIKHAIQMGVAVAALSVGIRGSRPVSQEIVVPFPSSITRSLVSASFAPVDTCITDKMPLPEYINEFYTIVGQTVADASEARIIFLGETHNIRLHQVLNTHLIDSVGNPGDLVLVEAVSRFERATPETNTMLAYAGSCDYFDGFVVQGWENKIAYEISRDVLHGVSNDLEWQEFLSIGLYGRNRELIELLEWYERNGNDEGKLFINAGSAHFRDDRVFQAYLSQIPSMALIPKPGIERSVSLAIE